MPSSETARSKSDYFRSYKVNINFPDTILKGNETRMEIPGCLDRDSTYWEHNRMIPLTKSEESIKMMSDHIQSIPSFDFFVKMINIFLSGYFETGPVEIGPVGSIYSFNEIEGLRMGLGLRTTRKFSEHWQIGGSGAFGFGDKVWKYSGQLKYFWDRKLKNYITVRYKRDYYFPGEFADFVRPDNLFLSFKRGVQDKMVDYTVLDVEYSHEFSNDYRMILTGKTGKESGLGTLKFIYDDFGEQVEIKQFNTFELGVKQRFSQIRNIIPVKIPDR